MMTMLISIKVKGSILLANAIGLFSVKLVKQVKGNRRNNHIKHVHINFFQFVPFTNILMLLHSYAPHL